MIPTDSTGALIRRMRRNRATPSVRALMRETVLRVEDLIQPLFVRAGEGDPEPVASMPGVVRHTVSSLAEECRKVADLGIPAVALFPKIESALKDPKGTHATDSGNVLYAAIRAIKKAVPRLTLIVDVALDPYTDHGHDGIPDGKGSVGNDATVEALCRLAVAQAEAGADMVMVKPAGHYLDVIRAVREKTSLPLAAYQVSGEYAQIHAAAQLGWLDYASTRDEALLAIKRAGADMILTYFASEVAAQLRGTH